MKRILITGASGLLGLNWAIHDCNLHHVILGIHERKIEFTGIESVQLYLGNVESAKECINKLKPDLIIHAAGYTSVEGCEKNPELARANNTDLASNISKVSAAFNIQLVHISTDHLFSGMNSLVTEEERINPQNIYGTSKAEAELRVLENDPKALVIRTNFYGWGPSYRPSFSDMIIKSLRLGKRITLFEDVLYTPILAEILIETVHELLAKKAHGVFNVVADEMISKYHFGLSIAECFSLDRTLIDRGKMIDMADLVKRPLNMSLSNNKVKQLLNHPLGSIQEHLRRLLEQEKTGLFNIIEKI